MIARPAQRWTPELDARLVALHGTMQIAEIASVLGTTAAAIRGRVSRLGIAKRAEWSESDIARLRALYDEAGHDGVLNLTAFAASIGRDKANVCRKARELGLSTNPHRRVVEARKDRRKFASKEEYAAARSERLRSYIAKNGHPRGMLGKKHTPEAIAAIAEKSSKYWASLSEDERAAGATKAVAKKVASGQGRAIPGGGRGTWKAGWREIGGKRNYYRSRWEANYARYLQWLKENGAISDWQHEPETFWFESIKRGVRSYLPDFRVWEVNGASSLHEVKGWMCARSKTTLARMAKYYPAQKIVLIDGKQYRAIRRKVMALIPDWEDAARDSHA